MKAEELKSLLILSEDSAHLPGTLEADAKQIATMAHETFEKYVLFLLLLLLIIMFATMVNPCFGFIGISQCDFMMHFLVR